MSIADDITKALGDAAKAGAKAASTAGRDLGQDINTLVVPHLEDIAIQIANIIVKRQQNIFTDKTAKSLIDSEEDAIETLVDTVVSLTAFEAQTIVNTIVDALNQSVNTALGFALLA
jgi:hypothetical protein